MVYVHSLLVPSAKDTAMTIGQALQAKLAGNVATVQTAPTCSQEPLKMRPTPKHLLPKAAAAPAATMAPKAAPKPAVQAPKPTPVAPKPAPVPAPQPAAFLPESIPVIIGGVEYTAELRTFSTGSIGYSICGKIVLPGVPGVFQTGLNMTLVGSKPKA